MLFHHFGPACASDLLHHLLLFHLATHTVCCCVRVCVCLLDAIHHDTFGRGFFLLLLLSMQRKSNEMISRGEETLPAVV